jgi:hypothetical protein
VDLELKIAKNSFCSTPDREAADVKHLYLERISGAFKKTSINSGMSVACQRFVFKCGYALT